MDRTLYISGPVFVEKRNNCVRLTLLLPRAYYGLDQPSFAIHPDADAIAFRAVVALKFCFPSGGCPVAARSAWIGAPPCLATFSHFDPRLLIS